MNNPNTEDTNNRAYMLQAIENQQFGVKGSHKTASLITQIAGIKTIADLHSFVKQHDLDKKRTQSIFKQSGYQLPSALKNSSSNIIIRKIDGNVNRKNSDITQSQQFIRWFGDWQNETENASKVVDNDGKPFCFTVCRKSAVDAPAFGKNLYKAKNHPGTNAPR